MTNTHPTLSEGPITKQLLKLGTPLLIGGLFQQLYSTVDSLVIGHWLGQTAFAASGLAAVLINVCIFLLTGCCAGVAILLANIYGRQDLATFRREVHISTILGGVFALLLTAGSWIMLPRILRAMQTPPEALGLATTYLRTIIGGLVITFIYNYFASILRSVGDTKRALYFLILANILNTALDIVLIGIIGTDISGAAWATVLAQAVAAGLCWQTINKRYPNLLPRSEDRVFSIELIRLTVYYASISALQTSLLCVGTVFVQRGVNVLGLTNMAAFAAASRIEGFAKAFAAAGAVALAIFIAHNQGAAKPERSEQGFALGLRYLSVVGILLGTVMYIVSIPLLRLFLGHDNTTALNCGQTYLRIVALCYWMPFLANAFQGWFRGYGWLSIPFYGTALQLTIRAFLVLNYAPQRGIAMVAWATIAGWIILILMQTVLYSYKRQRRDSAINVLLTEAKMDQSSSKELTNKVK